MSMAGASPELSNEQFSIISRMMYELCGICIPPGKEAMVKARLLTRLRVLGVNGFQEYLGYIKSDESGQELMSMIEALTTNKTSFFREPQHFEFLRLHILPGLVEENRRIRIWSAGCSSGEEPFSIAILLREAMADIGHRDVRVLATDISRRMLDVARWAEYKQESLGNIAQELLRKYFICLDGGPLRLYRVIDEVRQMVSLAWLNLIGSWPMKGPFNLIFCRNVMIYFDNLTRQRLLLRFWDLLEPGGYLMVGHSESLTGTSHLYRYVQPAIYVKEGTS